MTGRVLALAVAITALAAVPAVSSQHESISDIQSKLQAKLTGKAEVPGPGDPKATGTATFRTDTEKKQVCFTLSIRNLADGATAAHIHQGAKGKAGPIKVTLFVGALKRRGCTKNVTPSLIRSITRRPAGFYVNVHNSRYPAGAIRGQLETLEE